MDTSHKQEQLYGRKTWNLLHSMSAYYPEQPTAEDKANVKTFLESFMEVGIDQEKWGKKFLNRMSKEGENPLNLSSREDFSVWMCKQHNLFN